MFTVDGFSHTLVATAPGGISSSGLVLTLTLIIESCEARNGATLSPEVKKTSDAKIPT